MHFKTSDSDISGHENGERFHDRLQFYFLVGFVWIYFSMKQIMSPKKNGGTVRSVLIGNIGDQS